MKKQLILFFATFLPAVAGAYDAKIEFVLKTK